MGDTRVPLPAIHPDDKSDSYPGAVDVRLEVDLSESGVVLGEDLVLWIRGESDGDGGVRRWMVGVCDGSANHLHVLAITSNYPSDAVLTAAIETARASFPMYVRVPPAYEPETSDVKLRRRPEHGVTR